ncbi:hypothetical protein ACFQVC_32935 [Streptomyces monticola]|uniref:Uncharacterized protein n=1 Tax=Streptomyces monticola TaxID=2666263 RepID=A0ABW2JSN7_9ACTN
MLFINGLVLVGVAEAYAMRRRQRDWLAKTWGTYANFRASVDIEALRELKYRRGNFAVARRLKKQYPHLAPELAQALINEL